MENNLDIIILDNDVGEQLERQRFLTFLHESFEQLVPLARQMILPMRLHCSISIFQVSVDCSMPRCNCLSRRFKICATCSNS